MLRMPLLLAALALAPGLLRADEPEVIPAAEAKDHVDKECIVEMTVKSGRVMQEKNVCFLNSESRPSDDKNFTAFIGRKALKIFQEEKKIQNPPDKYVGKKIRVKGKIKLHKGKPEIEIDNPDQIEEVTESKSE
jgi:DNA/RNA endonuclease YhcR with UshA esterase domain